MFSSSEISAHEACPGDHLTGEPQKATITDRFCSTQNSWVWNTDSNGRMGSGDAAGPRQEPFASEAWLLRSGEQPPVAAGALGVGPGTPRQALGCQPEGEAGAREATEQLQEKGCGHGEKESMKCWQVA